MSEVLFVCTGNAARSQFAEAIYGNRFAESVSSAGTEAIVGKPLPEDVLTVLNEQGLEADDLYRKQLNVNLVATAKKLILMAEGSLPPYLDNAKNIIFWSIEDPRGKGLDAHRVAFEEVRSAIEKEFDEGQS